MLVAKMVQRFDIKVDPKDAGGIAENVTLKPKCGCRCTLTERA